MFSVKNVILQDLQQLAQVYCEKHLDTFWQKLDGKLGQLSVRGQSSKRKNANQQANINQLQAQFSDHFLALAQAFLQHRNDAGHLPPEARILDGKLGLYNMAIESEQRCHKQLNALNQRLSVMCQFRINSTQNPFSPVAFASALEQTITPLNWELHTRLVAFKLFNSEFLMPLAALYHDLNSKLIDYGILSNLKHEDAASERLRAKLHKAQIQFLDEHPNNDPAQSEYKALCEQSEETLAEVSSLFNQLLNSNESHTEMRNAIGRLYPSYVAIALSDDEFATSTQHPAQRILQHLQQATKVYADADTLQKPMVKSAVDALVKQLTQKHSYPRSILQDAAFRFHASLRHTERQQHWQRKQKQKGQAALKEIQRFKHNIVTIVDSKIASHEQQVPTSITLFLAHTWANYITSEFLHGNAHQSDQVPVINMIEPIIQYAAPSRANSNLDFTAIAPHIRNSLLASGSAELEVRQFLQRLMQYHKAAPALGIAHQKGLAS